jgi:hypothetical protein
MMGSKPFTPGQLVWTACTVDRPVIGFSQVARGYPDRIVLRSAVPCTIIRHALAKDFGTYTRHSYEGTSTAMMFAKTAWLVLYDGAPLLIDESILRTRRYKPRKTKQ